MGFLKWTARYGRNKFYKILLFFIIFCVISLFFSSCDAHAWTSFPSGTAVLYSKTANCTESGSNLVCENGQSLKFPFTFNSSSNIDIPVIMNNLDHGILFKNAIYDIMLDKTYIKGVNGVNSPALVFSSPNGLGGVSSTSSDMYFYYWQFRYNTYGINGTSIDYNYTIPLTYGFKPYYCSYYDPDAQETKTCNIILERSPSSATNFKVVVDLPSGAKFNRFTISFGTTDNYSGAYKTLCSSSHVPDSSTAFLNNSYCTDDTASGKYRIYYNTWRSSNYTSIGVQYIAQGYGLSEPKFHAPEGSDFVSYDSNSYQNNTYQFNFNNLSTAEKELYNNQVEDIENEIAGNQPSDDDIEDYVDGFVGSSDSNSFKNLFNALIQYPISRIQSQNNIGLTRTNLSGNDILSPAICYGIGENFGETLDPDKVFTYKGKSFHFPCVHYDIYQNIYSDNYAFYPSSMGSAHSNSHNIYSTIKMVLDGFLIYTLFLNVLDIYKYIFDSDRKEIEVIDL